MCKEADTTESEDKLKKKSKKGAQSVEPCPIKPCQEYMIVRWAS